MNGAGVRGVAKRIAATRAARQLSLADVARHLGIHDQGAYDLETYDDDLPTTLSLRQVRDLGELLALSPRRLVCGDELPHASFLVSPEAVVAAIRAHVAANRVTIEEFSRTVGWDVESAMGDPNRIWSDWNVDQAHDVCGAVNIDWCTLLPSADAGRLT